MMKTLMSVFACSLTACVVEPVDGEISVPETSIDGQEIIGGVVDAGDPCVVALFAHPPGTTSGALCTGTVIAPRTILTAAHCVDPRLIPPGSITEIIAGTTLSLPGIVASQTLFDPLWDPNNLFGGHDIGIVHTANPLPFPVCPIGPVSLTAPVPPVRLVGYGSNTHNNTGAGTKRQVTTNIVAANALLIQDGNSNQQTCHGDSGGPAFQTVGGVQRVVGVTSFGFDQPPLVCFNGGIHGRVDANLAFISANTF